eukprot:10599536-Ditylum_brightwellii.AAC.1
MKHKAQFCAYGGMQKWELDFWETFSPVVDLDVDVFMELPVSMKVNEGNIYKYVLRLKNPSIA